MAMQQWTITIPTHHATYNPSISPWHHRVLFLESLLRAMVTVARSAACDIGRACDSFGTFERVKATCQSVITSSGDDPRGPGLTFPLFRFRTEFSVRNRNSGNRHMAAHRSTIATFKLEVL